MRQIFTSPRLENVEAVDKLLADAGIDTRLTDARSWNRATKRDFSYTDRKGGGGYTWPACWVLKAEDYSRARQVLRDAGVVLPTTRSIEAPSYTPAAPIASGPPRASTATRVRLALLAVVLGVSAVYALRALGWL
jgi:hypothetical protein